MNKIDTTQLLEQLRAATRQAGGAPSASNDEQGASFSTLLAQSLDQVNELQQQSKALKERFQLGEPGVDLPDVMIAGGKAKLAFQAALQIRNKLVEAYQEISRMPV